MNVVTLCHDNDGVLCVVPLLMPLPSVSECSLHSAASGSSSSAFHLLAADCVDGGDRLRQLVNRPSIHRRLDSFQSAVVQIATVKSPAQMSFHIFSRVLWKRFLEAELLVKDKCRQHCWTSL